jgi:hypothetical protein
VVEPGLDMHDWETQYQALEEDLESSPAEALPELHALVERMLKERWIAIDDFVADDGVDPELRADFSAAREVVRRLNAVEDVDPGDIAMAINNDREIYAYLLAEYAAP